MKGIFLTSILALLIAAPAAAETVTLKFAGWGPPNVNINLAQQAWTRAVEKVNNGAVRIDCYRETLGNARTMYDVVRNDVADFGWIPRRQETSQCGAHRRPDDGIAQGNRRALRNSNRSRLPG